jgi:hypothetical protein
VSTNILDQVNLDSNPFAILDVTTRDTRERIYEAAEDRSLVGDPDACAEARAILTAPRRRFEAELGWFPGVAPSTAKRAMEGQTLSDIDRLPISGLSLANALSAYGLRHPPATPDEIVALLKATASAIDGLSLEVILRDVNEDREVAGLSAIHVNRYGRGCASRPISGVASRSPLTAIAASYFRDGRGNLSRS